MEEPSPAVFSVPTGTSDSHHGHRRWHKIHGCLVRPPAGAAEAEPSGLFYLHHRLVRCNLVRNWAPLLVEPRGSSNGCGLGSGRTLNFPIPSKSDSSCLESSALRSCGIWGIPFNSLNSVCWVCKVRLTIGLASPSIKHRATVYIGHYWLCPWQQPRKSQWPVMSEPGVTVCPSEMQPPSLGDGPSLPGWVELARLRWLAFLQVLNIILSPGL